MSDIICVTNRQLCTKPFLQHIRRLAEAYPAAVILREKDLPEKAYRDLAEEVLAICRANHVPCILHSFSGTAAALGADALHMPLLSLHEMTEEERKKFRILGASCHSVEDAVEAEALGCTYLIAGHIFETDCKKGLAGRGLSFLKEICRSVSIPVYAIGGISEQNISAVRETGAAGACVMSGSMQCEDPAAYLKNFEKREEHL